jgi:hypothetical protein
MYKGDIPVNDITYKGYKVACFSTAYGDGCYRGSDSNEYPVDAGCIAMVPVAVCDRANIHSVDIIETTTDTVCYYIEKNGIIVFGGVEIQTDGDDEEFATYTNVDED